MNTATYRALLEAFASLAVIAFLSGCATTSTTTNTPPIATASFVALAQASDCHDIRNNLFVIDNRQVFWTRAGNCSDNAYAHVLYGSAPTVVLCQSSDSIAGPMTTCQDESYREMFLTIENNLDKENLGLDSSHKVEKVAF